MKGKIHTKPYFTTYPFSHWCWFDVKIYGEFSPKAGNLPSDVFARLKGGNPNTVPNAGCLSYKKLEDAIADYEQAKGAI